LLPTIRLQSLLVVAAAVGLAGVGSFALQHEASRPTQSEPVLPTVSEPIKALSPAEEAYAGALWPIHRGIVQSTAVELATAGLMYVTEDHDVFKFTEKLRRLDERLRTATAQVRDLAVPPSLGAVHDQYLQALTSYSAALAEMLKTGHDADDEHLVAAQAMSQRASGNLLEVGNVLWPGERKPN
jgi:hypothetical protein